MKCEEEVSPVWFRQGKDSSSHLDPGLLDLPWLSLSWLSLQSELLANISLCSTWLGLVFVFGLSLSSLRARLYSRGNKSPRRKRSSRGKRGPKRKRSSRGKKKTRRKRKKRTRLRSRRRVALSGEERGLRGMFFFFNIRHPSKQQCKRANVK